ncbi:MAG: endonuclease III [Ignavibacteriales bacterium]|nr:endonuclease III [Ignavibacteriales bacterium]
MKRKENLKELRLRAKKIVARLRKGFPGAKTALRHQNPFQLLVATILSAQCTDARVNMVTPGLFAKYPTVGHFASLKQEELEEEIRSTGFFRNKARSIIAASKSITEQFGGAVPNTMEDLLKLGGVGRKTANCVLGGAFGINEGVVVDTHVERLSQRLGLTTQKSAEKIERDLMEIIPQSDWYELSNLLILHGRKVCSARKPRCPECSLKRLCPSADSFMRTFWKQT